MSTDRKGAKILARTFFNQLRSGGYTPSQIIAISSELIDLVTCELKDGSEKVGPPVEAPREEAPSPPAQGRTVALTGS